MRLTLRTLLAYLDDILEPLEIKAIGQKVAESKEVQELIARIKQVTRRRRITTPPATGPNAFEPNTVAEYLDNVLSPEQVAEVEKLCLESDVHLAEVASCHQILTLVLGEPAVVPPTAKERMYALVQGREAIPSRKAAASSAAAAPTLADADADEMFLLGLPFYRRGSWLRWALPLAAVVLIAVIAVALWQSIPVVQPPPPSNTVAQNANTEAKVPEQAPPPQEVKAGNTESKNAPAVKPEKQDKLQNKPPDENQTKQSKSGPPQQADKINAPPATGTLVKTPDKTPAPPAVGRRGPPSTERVEVGKYIVPDFAPPSLLVHLKRKDDKDSWDRLAPGSPISSGEPIMSLPGYASEVRLDCGVHLLLRGHVREFTPQLQVKDQAGRVHNEAGAMDYLQECALVLHKPTDTDADLTLQRGRLYLSNHNKRGEGGKEGGATVVRLRFENKIWDLTLQPDAEMVVDLFKTWNSGQPLSVLKLFLLAGQGGIALDHDRYPDLSEPGRAQFFWNSLAPSRYERPLLGKQDLETAYRVIFPKRPTADTREARGMDLALKAVRGRINVGEDPVIVLRDVLESTEKIFEHWLALYCLAALDEIKIVMDVLGRADQIHAPDREAAIFSIRRWLDHGPGQEERLYNPKAEKDPKAKIGILVSELLYTHSEAKRIMELLHDPSTEEVFSKEYYEDRAQDLASEKVAIAELARWRLYLLAVGMFHLDMPKLTIFNAARPRNERIAAMREVLDRISEGLLPPPSGIRKSGPPTGAPRPKR